MATVNFSHPTFAIEESGRFSAASLNHGKLEVVPRLECGMEKLIPFRKLRYSKCRKVHFAREIGPYVDRSQGDKTPS
jgi:hypothetical protein